MSRGNSPYEYNGKCAFAVSTGKTNIEGGKHELKIAGKKYKFSNVLAKMLFKVLPNRIEKANKAWNENQKKPQQ